jgi:hypothetical protein
VIRKDAVYAAHEPSLDLNQPEHNRAELRSTRNLSLLNH